MPHGLFVTNEMQSVLDAVLSDTSTQQIGFCGMGGVGKTTVSSWVARDNDVRKRFGVVAWVTLGQAPAFDSCLNLLYGGSSFDMRLHSMNVIEFHTFAPVETLLCV
jgi:hypothetical protein